MFFLIYLLGVFSALFFFFFCQNFANNFPYLIPPTKSGSKASLGPSGLWGLASNPVQQLSKASLGQVGLFTIPLGLFSTGHLGPSGPSWIEYPPEGTWLSSLSWPIWPCGACNPSCSKPIQGLTGPIWLLHHPVRKFLSSLSWPIWLCGACNQSCSKSIQALTGPTWLCGACNS